MSFVFISYSRKDDAYTERLCSEFEKWGFEHWIDKDIEYSDAWFRTIERQIETCAAVVVIMTPEAETSAWVHKEILLAIRYKKPIFPIKLRGNEFGILIDVQAYEPHEDREYLPSSQFFQNLAKVVPINGLQSISALHQATHDSNINVRKTAIQSLAKLGAYPEIANPLIDMLDDENKEVRQEVFNALETIGAPCVKRLMNIISGEEPKKHQGGKDVGRINAIRLLAHLMMVNPSLKATRLLMKMLSDTDPSIRIESAIGLDRWQSTRAIPALMKRLDDFETDGDGFRVDEIAALAMISIATSKLKGRDFDRVADAFSNWYFTNASEDFKERFPITEEDIVQDDSQSE